MDRQELINQILQIETQLESLRRILQQPPQEPDIYSLAEFLHEKQCKVSHVDICSWEYENDEAKPNSPWLNVGRCHCAWLGMAIAKAEKAKEQGITIAQLMEIL